MADTGKPFDAELEDLKKERVREIRNDRDPSRPGQEED